VSSEIKLVARVAASTALGGLALGLVAASVAVSTGDVSSGLILRGVLVLIAVLLVSRQQAAGGRRAGVARVQLLTGLGALIGFALDPFTWAARTALTQAFTDPGPATLVGDLALWMLAATLGVLWATRTVSAPAVALTPYG
jgi:hypothetical protein